MPPRTEAGGIWRRSEDGVSGDRAHSGYRQEALGLRVGLATPFDDKIECGDALTAVVNLTDELQQRIAGVVGNGGLRIRDAFK